MGQGAVEQVTVLRGQAPSTYEWGGAGYGAGYGYGYGYGQDVEVCE